MFRLVSDWIEPPMGGFVNPNGSAEAEKLRLSIARPCALPVESVICQPSQSAVPGSQGVASKLVTLKLV